MLPTPAFSMELGARAWSGEGLVQVLLAGGCVGSNSRHGAPPLLSRAWSSPWEWPSTQQVLSGVWSGGWGFDITFQRWQGPTVPFCAPCAAVEAMREEETVLSPTWDCRGRCCWNAHFSLPPVLVTVLLLLFIVFKK